MNVVITGAGKGIGLELAKIFSANNHNTIAISRNILALQEIENEFLNPISFDLTSGDYSNLYSKINNTFNKIDVLINNAGAMVNKPFKDLTETDFDIIFNTNVKAVFLLVKNLLPIMNKKSHIVNISSMGGVQGSSKFKGLSLYSSSKGALGILTECLAEELKEHEISVNALALGAVQTEMLAEAFPGYQAPLNANQMASYIYDFSQTGHNYYNGKILPISISTP
jgi:NAD(P)-dependent dehydrogenase (short-subunit alcohol dehydrogenase family)